MEKNEQACRLDMGFQDCVFPSDDYCYVLINCMEHTIEQFGFLTVYDLRTRILGVTSHDPDVDMKYGWTNLEGITVSYRRMGNGKGALISYPEPLELKLY